MTPDEARAALKALEVAEVESHWNAQRSRSWRPLAVLRPELYDRAREARKVLARPAPTGLEMEGRPT